MITILSNWISSLILAALVIPATQHRTETEPTKGYLHSALTELKTNSFDHTEQGMNSKQLYVLRK